MRENETLEEFHDRMEAIDEPAYVFRIENKDGEWMFNSIVSNLTAETEDRQDPDPVLIRMAEIIRVDHIELKEWFKEHIEAQEDAVPIRLLSPRLLEAIHRSMITKRS